MSDLTRELAQRLDARAEPATKQWWERYLRGEARFRGVKMAHTRAVVGELWREHGLEQWERNAQLALAFDWIRGPFTEDKLAGILLLAERLLTHLQDRHVELLAAPLAGGDLADWNVVDWFCVKVLGPFIAAGDDPARRGHAIADWRHAQVLWQKRASAVAFVPHAKRPNPLFDGAHELMLSVCRSNAGDPRRFSQTSVGWLLRELSHVAPNKVRDFLRAHPELSSEARRAASKYLP